MIQSKVIKFSEPLDEDTANRPASITARRLLAEAFIISIRGSQLTNEDVLAITEILSQRAEAESAKL